MSKVNLKLYVPPAYPATPATHPARACRGVMFGVLTIVGELIRSPNPPEISMLPLPNIGDEDTALNLSWTGTDADGDTLTYSVGYNCDGADIWVPLIANLIDPLKRMNPFF